MGRPCYDRHPGPHALRRSVRRLLFVPSHVEMMGFLGMDNNPMVGATVAVAVSVAQAL